jgi:hypothetical protein
MKSTINLNNVVAELKDEYKHFQIEKLDPPIQKGAGLRYYRLWEDGYPASGWQWCYNLDHAIENAKYIMERNLYQKINLLKERVRQLEAQLYRTSKTDPGEWDSAEAATPPFFL